MTVQTLINLCFRDLEVTYSGQTPSTDQSNDAFSTLNEILGAWSHEGLLVPTHELTNYSLASGTSSYSFGVSGSWNTAALPIKLKGAVASLAGFQQGVAILSMEAFQAAVANAIARTTALPEMLGIDNAAPLRNVFVYPTPNNSSAIVAASFWIALAAFSTLGDTVNFALPAFEEAVRNELTLRLASMHHIPVSQILLSNAQSSKQALSRIDPSEVTEQVGMQPQQTQARPAV